MGTPVMILIAQLALSVAIAVGGIALAYAQLRIASQKMALDLFGPRMKIVEGVADVVRKVLASASAADNADFKMLMLALEPKFVFGEKVELLIKSLADKMNKIRIAEGELQRLEEGEHRTALGQKKDENVVAVSTEYERLFGVYFRYMKMDMKVVPAPRELWRDLTKGREEEAD